MRSNNGCWTCRLRHRKCDEGVPTCKQCARTRIQCRGYGAKPVWMDGGSLERQQASLLKKEVKQARALFKQGQTNSSEHIAGRHLDDFPLADPNSTIMNDGGRLDLHNLTADRCILHQGYRAESFEAGNPVCSFREAELLIHYLDNILPLQFPYCSLKHRLRIKTWLFWLLTKNEPLRDAVLSLSALHRSKTESWEDQAHDDLLFYHTRALKNLQQLLQRRLLSSSSCNREELAELLAVGTCLISFEVFQNGNSEWQLHLGALTSIVKLLEPVLIEDLPSDNCKSTDSMLDSIRWTVGVVIWFDVLSTTSLHTLPRTNYHAWLGSNFVDMVDVMGCENWLFIAIGDIAALNFKKRNALHDQFDGVRSIRPNGIEIIERLRSGIKSFDDKLEEVSHQARGYRLLPSFHNSSELLSTTISRLFAYAALVQSLTISMDYGPCHPELRNVVSEMLIAMRDFPNGISIRGLVWSLCVAGSMVEPQKQPLFEAFLLKDIQDLQNDFGNCGAVLQILRACWAMRLLRSDEIWNWHKAMETTNLCVLLV